MSQFTVFLFRSEDHRWQDNAGVKHAVDLGLPIIFIACVDIKSWTRKWLLTEAMGKNRQVFKLQSLYELSVRLKHHTNLSLKFSSLSPLKTIEKLVHLDGFKNLVICEETGLYEQKEQNELAKMCAENEINFHSVWDQSFLSNQSLFDHILSDGSEFKGKSLLSNENLPALKLSCPDRAMSFMKVFESNMKSEASALEYAKISGQMVDSWPFSDEFVAKTLDHQGKVSDLLQKLGLLSFESLLAKLEIFDLQTPKLNYDLVLNADSDILVNKNIYTGGESAAWFRLKDYIWNTHSAAVYKTERKRSHGKYFSSKFAVWIHTGNISVRQIVNEIAQYEKKVLQNADTYYLVSELMWREWTILAAISSGPKLFSYHGDNQNFQKWTGQYETLDFDSEIAQNYWKAWSTGQTGFPMIDAWMRELVSTGWVSNRGRQCLASFLIYNLKIDWRYGAEYMEHHFIDHHVGPNYVNWNIAAGIGWNKYSRVLNPIRESRKFDNSGEHIRTWCKEIQHLPDDFINIPWEYDGFVPQLYRNPILPKDAFKYQVPRPRFLKSCSVEEYKNHADERQTQIVA